MNLLKYSKYIKICHYTIRTYSELEISRPLGIFRWDFTKQIQFARTNLLYNFNGEANNSL